MSQDHNDMIAKVREGAASIKNPQERALALALVAVDNAVNEIQHDTTLSPRVRGNYLECAASLALCMLNILKERGQHIASKN